MSCFLITCYAVSLIMSCVSLVHVLAVCQCYMTPKGTAVLMKAVWWQHTSEEDCSCMNGPVALHQSWGHTALEEEQSVWWKQILLTVLSSPPSLVGSLIWLISARPCSAIMLLSAPGHGIIQQWAVNECAVQYILYTHLLASVGFELQIYCIPCIGFKYLYDRWWHSHCLACLW